MEFPLLSSLSEEERRGVVSRARRRRFSKGEVVFHEGDPGNSLHLVAKGHVAVRVTTPMGDAATLLVLGPGEVFGELALVAPAPRNATVSALDVAETLSIHQDAFDELRAHHPAVDRVLVGALAEEVRRLSRLLLDAMYVPVERRMFRRLAELSTAYGSGDAAASIPLTQEDLAQVVGTTRQTLNPLLKAAEEAGVLRVSRGRVEILDRERLLRRAR